MDSDGSGDLSKAEFLEGAHKDSLILGKGHIASIWFVLQQIFQPSKDTLSLYQRSTPWQNDAFVE